MTSPSENLSERKDPTIADGSDPLTGSPNGTLQPTLLDRLFRKARTPVSWSERAVSPDIMETLYELTKWGPTSGNCSPARFIFLTSRESRGLIRDALSEANVSQFLDAPLGVVVAYDPLFFDQLPELNAEAALRDWFAADVGLADETAFRNGTLQGAYMIMAARAMGFSVLPMSGFDSDYVEDALMAEAGWRANFLLAIGYEGDAPPPARAARLDFHDACRYF